MQRITICLASAFLIALCSTASSGLAPHNIAVIVNTNPNLNADPEDLITMSQAVGYYYSAQRGIPVGNIIEVYSDKEEYVPAATYQALAAQIRAKLVTQLGVDPDDPASDPIQALVLCYGVPFKINAPVQDDQKSVDSFLTLLFNEDPDLGPLTFAGATNPYLGKDIDFASFRASPDNSIPCGDDTYKMRYLVCRLDGYTDPLVTVTGYDGQIPQDVMDMIDRAHDSAGQRGRFVHDLPWTCDYLPVDHSGTDCSWLDPILEPDLIIHDCDASTCYVKTFADQLGVMAYSSYGMHDTDILESTEWGRPYFNWKPGAISVIQESYGGSSLRTGLFAFWDDDNVETLNTPVLRVDAGIYLFGGVRHVVPLPSYRVGIFDKHDDSPLRWMRNGQLCDVETHVPAGGVAEIDLSDQTI